jgi:hypothetical protein
MKVAPPIAPPVAATLLPAEAEALRLKLKPLKLQPKPLATKIPAEGPPPPEAYARSQEPRPKTKIYTSPTAEGTLRITVPRFAQLRLTKVTGAGDKSNTEASRNQQMRDKQAELRNVEAMKQMLESVTKGEKAVDRGGTEVPSEHR